MQITNKHNTQTQRGQTDMLTMTFIVQKQIKQVRTEIKHVPTQNKSQSLSLAVCVRQQNGKMDRTPCLGSGKLAGIFHSHW